MVSNQILGFIAKAKEDSRFCFLQNWEAFYYPKSHKILFSVTDLEMPGFFPFPTLQNDLVKVLWKTLKQNQGKP